MAFELQMYGGLSPYEISARYVAEQLKRAGNGNEIRVRMHSPGGSPFEGVAIRSLLDAHQGKKTIVVDGIAASAASVALMAEGAEVEMAEGSFMMIHNSASGMEGGAKDLEHEAAILRAIDDQTAQLYARRSKQPVEKIRKMMDAETWLTAQDAVKLGFADRVVRGSKVTQQFKLDGYVNVPSQLAGILTPHSNPNYGASMLDKQIRQRLGLPETATDEQVMVALTAATAGTVITAQAPAAPAPAVTAEQIAQMVREGVTQAMASQAVVQAHVNAAANAVDQFIQLRKIAPAQRAQAIAACGDNAKQLAAQIEYWKDAPEVVPAAVKLGTPTGTGFTPSQGLSKMIDDSGVSPTHIAVVDRLMQAGKTPMNLHITPGVLNSIRTENAR